MPRSRRPQGQDRHDGVATRARIAAREVVSFESSGSIGYDCGVKSDDWEMPTERFEFTAIDLILEE